MTPIVRPFVEAFGNAHFSLCLQLGDLSNEDAVKRTRDGAGASISWIVGHLLKHRCDALNACGIEHPNPYAGAFSFDTPATDGSTYPHVGELQTQWNDIHEKLIAAMSNLDEDRLTAADSSPHGEPSLLGSLVFTMWHEAYHIGAIGLLRVEMGYRHTHELAIEAMQEASRTPSS